MHISSSRKPRLEAIDIARGTALVAMAIYHCTWDLEFFGYLEPGLTASPGWKVFARSIASSFIFLAGMSLVLAHGEMIRPGSFLKRFAMIAGAAALISVASYLFAPQAFIFFGILHAIALFSIAGLLFMHLPWWTALLGAIAAIAAPHYLRAPVFDTALLWWVGLAPSDPVSNDYVPLFPWIGPFLAGIALSKLRHPAQVPWVSAVIVRDRISRILAFGGRHSLAVYLVHQPLLIAVIWLFSQLVPAQTGSPQAVFLNACQRGCEEQLDTGFCTRYCICMLDTLEAEDRLNTVMSGQTSETDAEIVRNHVEQCTTASTSEGQ